MLIPLDLPKNSRNSITFSWPPVGSSSFPPPQEQAENSKSSQEFWPSLKSQDQWDGPGLSGGMDFGMGAAEIPWIQPFPWDSRAWTHPPPPPGLIPLRQRSGNLRMWPFPPGAMGCRSVPIPQNSRHSTGIRASNTWNIKISPLPSLNPKFPGLAPNPSTSKFSLYPGKFLTPNTRNKIPGFKSPSSPDRNSSL